MNISDFQIQTYCGDFAKQTIRSEEFLVADVTKVKKHAINAFSGEEGELLGRIFCNIDCVNGNEIEEFYRKYGCIGHAVTQGAETIEESMEHVLSYQRDVKNALTLSAAIEYPRTTDIYIQMMSAMLYFLLFSESSPRSSVSLDKTRKVGMWALQRRFRGKLRQENSIGGALYELLKEYDSLQEGNRVLCFQRLAVQSFLHNALPCNDPVTSIPNFVVAHHFF